MAAGWLYYHKYPPKRKCPKCGKRHSLKRGGGFSNGEDIWFIVCPKDGKNTGRGVTSKGYEF